MKIQRIYSVIVNKNSRIRENIIITNYKVSESNNILEGHNVLIVTT